MGRSRLGKGFLPLLMGLLLFILPAAGASGRVGATIRQVPLQHEVSVALKLIQVFVTDAQGKPVLDLEMSDFLLTDNGRSQTITDFEKHVLSTLPSMGAGTALAPSAARETPAPLLSRKFIFFIDFGRNDLEGLVKAKKAAVEFLDSKIQKDDEVALFSLSTAGGLTLHEFLTSDHAKVEAAIKRMRDIPGIAEAGMSSVSIDHEPMGMEIYTNQVFGQHGGHTGAGSRNVFAEVGELAKALRTIPGQKNIILFSRGFGNSVVRPGGTGNSLFQAMARALAAANAPVFSVDTTTGFAAKVAAGVFPEQSLDYLSETTGGKYMGGVDYSSRIAADIQEATGNYYVLGYTIPASWDGAFHDVKVEVRKPGFTVHAQSGYFNPLPFAELSPVEKHLHLLEVALGENSSAKRDQTFALTALQFAGAAEADGSHLSGHNTFLLSEIPLDFRESVGDRVEFISLILNQSRAIVDGKRVEIDWADFRTGRIYPYTSAALAPGRYDCRAVFRNLDDGRAAVGSCSVDVAALPAEGPIVFPPLFFVRGQDSRFLNLVSQKDKGVADGPSISGIFPFPAKEFVPLVGSLRQGASELWGTLKCIWRGARVGEIELSFRLTPEGGEEEVPIPAEILDASSRDDADFCFLRFELPELLPGRYRLEILAGEAGTGPVVRTAGWFTVRPPE